MTRSPQRPLTARSGYARYAAMVLIAVNQICIPEVPTRTVQGSLIATARWMTGAPAYAHRSMDHLDRNQGGILVKRFNLVP